jgi:hypothetical protein
MRVFSFHQVEQLEVVERESNGHQWVVVRLLYADGSRDEMTFHNRGEAPRVVDARS